MSVARYIIEAYVRQVKPVWNIVTSKSVGDPRHRDSRNSAVSTKAYNQMDLDKGEVSGRFRYAGDRYADMQRELRDGKDRRNIIQFAKHLKLRT